MLNQFEHIVLNTGAYIGIMCTVAILSFGLGLGMGLLWLL
jgi:hypothetical protein